MKKTKLQGYLLALSIAIASCTGDDGDPGPQGATGATGATGEQGAAGEGFEKAGYFQGTVSGNRTDGTAFSETFNYEYGPPVLVFAENYIDLVRYNKAYYHDGYFAAGGLQLSGNTLVTDPTLTTFHLKFSKELNATDLFVVNARPYFYDLGSYVIQISADQNEAYKFSTNEDGTVTYGYNAPDVYTIHRYTNPFSYIMHYSKTDGTLQTINANGNHITSGTLFDLYDQLVFKHNTDVDQPTFFDKATDVSLHTVIPDVPADQFTLTNFSHDASTGVMSFDFVLKISQYRPRTGHHYGVNSSGNDLTISGSFNSGKKVYSNVVGRAASGG